MTTQTGRFHIGETAIVRSCSEIVQHYFKIGETVTVTSYRRTINGSLSVGANNGRLYQTILEEDLEHAIQNVNGDD